MEVPETWNKSEILFLAGSEARVRVLTLRSGRQIVNVLKEIFVRITSNVFGKELSKRSISSLRCQIFVYRRFTQLSELSCVQYQDSS